MRKRFDSNGSGEAPFNKERKDRSQGGSGRSGGGFSGRSEFKKDFSEGGERRPFNSRPPRSNSGEGRSSGGFSRDGGFKKDFSGGGERRPFGDRPPRSNDGERRSSGGFSRDGGFKKDFSGGGERRSFGDRPPRFNDGEKRSSGGFSRDGGFKKDFSGGGERRSFGDRPPRFNDGERRSFGGGFSRDGGFKKDFSGGGERRSFGDRPPRSNDGEGRSSGGFSRDGGFKKDFSGGGERRSFGNKPRFGGNNRSGGEFSRGGNGGGGSRRQESVHKDSAPIIKLEDIITILEKNPLPFLELARYLKIERNDNKFLSRFIASFAEQKVLKEENGIVSIYYNYIPKTFMPKKAILTITYLNSLGEAILDLSNHFKNNIKDQGYKIYIKNEHNLKIGDKIFAEISEVATNLYKAHIIKFLPSKYASEVFGVYKNEDGTAKVIPLNSSLRENFLLRNYEKSNLTHGAIIKIKIIDTEEDEPKAAELLEVIDNKDLTTTLSSISIYEFNLPHEFPSDVLKEALDLKAPTLEDEGREDFTKVPFVTIDGSDAKDFDDAVYAEKINDDYKVYVAIADVSHYVAKNSALDKEAFKRGNSVYLPGLVIPMLPENLSNNLCSLMPNQERAAIVAEILIDNQGNIKEYDFKKGLIKSSARLTYDEVEDSLFKETVSENIKPVMESTIKPIYEVYKILKEVKKSRHALEIDSKEYNIVLNDDNTIKDINLKQNLTSNQIIEELMILANVASAKFLEDKGFDKDNLISYRVHEKSTLRKLENFVAAIKSLKIVKEIPRHIDNEFFNSLIEKYKNDPLDTTINEIVLRAQSQARYSTFNIGHQGLALSNYCHFTSPIRRYSDLTVHRLITSSLLNQPITYENDMISVCEHISATEVNAMKAEFKAKERLISEFLSSKMNQKFDSYISSITSAGIFVNLLASGASGLIPIRSLGNERFNLDKETNSLTGQESLITFKIGDKLPVVLKESDSIRGLLTFNLDLNR